MYWFWTPCISLRASLIHLSLSALTSPSTLANYSGFMYWKMSLFCGDFNHFIPSDLNSDLQCKYYLFTKYFKIFYLYTYVCNTPVGQFYFWTNGHLRSKLWWYNWDLLFLSFLVQKFYSYQKTESCILQYCNASLCWLFLLLPTHLNQRSLNLFLRFARYSAKLSIKWLMTL